MTFLTGTAPLAAWVVAGSLKFAINSLRRGRMARDEIGYGGFPSTHSAIVSAAVTAVLLEGGVASPALPVAVAVALVVMLDATGLRRHVGAQAQRINRLVGEDDRPLRERLGHRWSEVGGGVVVGAAVTLLMHAV